MLQPLLGLLESIFRSFGPNPVGADIDTRFKSDMPYSPPKFPPIYAPWGFSGTIDDLVNVIKASDTKTFDLDLERTFVTNVSHWRNPTSEQELVTVTYKVGNSGEHTTRHLGLERFRLQTSRTGSAVPDTLTTLFGSIPSSSSEFLTEPNSGIIGSIAKLDNALISDELHGKRFDVKQTAIMSSEYERVRSFDIPIHTVPVLKAASLAAALSTACNPYSYFQHMCWLWASLYMLLVHVELTVSPSPRPKANTAEYAGPAVVLVTASLGRNRASLRSDFAHISGPVMPITT